MMMSPSVYMHKAWGAVSISQQSSMPNHVSTGPLASFFSKQNSVIY